jgi:archaellum component FlaC
MQMNKLAILSSALLLPLCACKTTGVDKVSTTAATMTDIRTELEKAPASIDAVANTIDTLSKFTGNVKAQFHAYERAIKDMESHAERVRSLRKDFKAQQAAFSKHWATQLEKITDEDLRKQAADRRDKALAVFKELSDEADAVKAKFDPWMVSVNDVRTYLENDLNPAGIKSVNDRIKKIKSTATTIKKEIADVNQTLVEVVDAISATKPDK